ncbi:MAG: hypothetical protein F6J92_17995 [Symploca sp. SIO1A3]|nr:hypothetical protein [Symploca sp. SIO1A3]
MRVIYFLPFFYVLLDKFHYNILRSDPATPSQYVICAYTKLSGSECPLLITLKPEANPYETLREMTAALKGGDGVYQNTDGSSTDTLSPESPEVHLRSLLAEEDRN